MSDDIQDAAAISDPNDSSYDPSASENGNGEEPTAVAAARAPSPNSEPRSNATDGTEGNMMTKGFRIQNIRMRNNHGQACSWGTRETLSRHRFVPSSSLQARMRIERCR
jgi:hypothetical protein